MQASCLAEITAQWSQRLNLTGFSDPLSLARQLVIEPLLWSRFLEKPQSIVDLGSGAGFPGFPLALHFPDVSILLIEARRRRHHFQRHIIRELALPRVEALLGRIEVLEPRISELVVAQALAAPDRALQLMLPWAMPGGCLAIPTHAPRDIIVPPLLQDSLEIEEAIAYPRFDGSTGYLWRARRVS